MANLIDSLLIAIGFDTTGLKKGAAEAKTSLGKTSDQADATRKKMEEAAKKSGEAIAQLRNEILRTAAALVGLEAIKSFVSNVTKTDGALGFMAANVHMTTQALSAWQGAAEAAGGSADAMGSDIKSLAQQLSRFQLTGEGGGFVRYLQALKVAMVDAHDKARPMHDVMLDLADRFHGMDPTARQTMGAGLGLSEDTINFLSRGRVEVQKFVDTYETLNARTPQDNANALARTQAWVLLKATFNRLATDVLNGLTPALTGLMDFIRNHAGISTALIVGITTALTAMSMVRFGGMLASLAQLVTSLRAVSLAAAGTVAAEGGALTLSSIGGAAGGVLMLARAGGLLGLAATGGYLLGSALESWLGLGSKAGDAVFDFLNPNAGLKPWAPSSGKGGGSSSWAAMEKAAGLPAGILAAVKANETGSGSGIGAVSPKGARGPFQIMPATGAQYGAHNLDDPEDAARVATAILGHLFHMYGGDVAKTLAAYNEGEGNVAKGRMPTETANYVRMAMQRMGLSQSIANNSNSSETHIGQLTVHVPSGDPQSIAHHLPRALKNQSFALQANAGLSS